MITLGFIGIGNMGMPMVRRLIEAGHDVVVCDTDRQKIASLGVRAAATPGELAESTDIVLLSLPVPAAVREVCGGMAGGGRAKVVVDLSTTGRGTTVEVARALGARGIILIDAPVSGGVIGAAKGTLAVMVAGPLEARERVRPILDVIGKVFVVGDEAGQGQVMKVLNNLLSATAMAATSEAMIAGVKAGLDPKTMIDVLNAGSGRSTATTDKFPRAVLDRSFDFGFRAVLLHKDVRLCRDLAEGLGTPFSIGTAVEQVWAEAARKIGDGDFTRVVEVLEQGTGVKVGKEGQGSALDPLKAEP